MKAKNRIVPADDENIQLASEIIRSGGVVAFPTETVYGLGADALNETACAKIFEIKNRPFFDPLIVHLSDITMLDVLVAAIPAIAYRLMREFWPGPITLVLKKKVIIPDIVTAGLDTVAVRMPSHPVARKLIEMSNTPLAAPSANPFGYISPTEAMHVFEQLGTEVDMILDGGACQTGIESTILDMTTDSPVILRPGGITKEEISQVTGMAIEVQPYSPIPVAPGMLQKHYAPLTPIIIFSGEIPVPDKNRKAALLAFKTPERTEDYQFVEILSPKGDLREAASNLFRSMRKIDALQLDIIYAEAVPETGLGHAIMDRLKKALGKAL